MALLVSHNSWWELGRGRDFVWCSWRWGEESTKPSFYSDSKNLVAQQRWHVLTSNTLSRAFISRASIPVMCVSCFLRPPCFPQALSRHHRSEALSTAVCLCTRACLWMCLRGVEGISNLANRCIIFGMVAPSLRRASLKSLGSLHPLHPPLAQTLGVKPSMAQLGSLTAATAAAQNQLDLWPVHGPVPTAPHYTAHRWLHHLLEITITGVQQVFEGIPPSSERQRLDSAAGLPVHVFAAN